MADDQDQEQKTEQPTQKRLDQAREAGDTVKSAEVNTLVLLGGGTLALAMFGKYTMLGIARALRIFIEQPETMNVDGTGIAAILRMMLIQLATACGPIFGVLALLLAEMLVQILVRPKARVAPPLV